MLSESKNNLRYSAVFAVLILLFFFAVIWNINTGSVHIPIPKILSIIFGRNASDTTAYGIIWKIRLPRLMLAAILGGALSLSGFLLQTFFRNPIAGPFVLGISSGAKMFLAIVTIALAGFFTNIPVTVTILASFIGSMLSMLLVLLFSGKIKNMSMLLVIGIMISYICSAVTDFLINFANDADIVNLTHWSHGSFSAASWAEVGISALIVIPTFIVIFCLSKPISAYSLGEGYAQSLGVNVKLFRVLLIILSSILSACVTAFAGPISFVGIAVPHIVRIMFKTSKPIIMVPACVLTGAVFCMLCDLLARTMFAPVELSISTVTSAIGAPIVIKLMVSRRKKNES
ncbi:MAG: iron ABC transporter permease [Clostridiales bacterium]|nr:iron ABC transporter permease [Clostridiales bacterium]